MSAYLNFIILKINGIDLSNLSHDEAVQLFLKANDPIVIHVRRRTSADSDKLTLFDDRRPFEPQLELCRDNKTQQTSVECQTDFMELMNSRTFAIDKCCHLTDTQNIFGQCLAPEIDIEEITLRKSRSDEKLGFTVSYSSGNGSASASTSGDDDDDDDNNDQDDNNADVADDEDTCADIYISDILPDSLAARDGRLRQGDQIIQINGRDVSSKDETESLFAENKNAITLLVSRCLYTDDEFLDSAVYCDDKDHNAGLSLSCDCEQSTFSSKSSLKSLSEPYKSTLQAISALDTSVCDHANIKAQLESVNKEITLLNTQIANMKLQKGPTSSVFASAICTTSTPTSTTTATAKSSPAAIFLKNKKNETLLAACAKKSINEQQQQRIFQQYCGGGVKAMNVGGGGGSTSAADTEHIYETIPEESETDSYYCSPYETKDKSRIEQWLKSQEGNGTTMTSAAPPKREQYLNQATLSRIYRNNSSGDDCENSSSAYNTGGSCNSNPLTFELKSDDKNQSSSTLVFRPYSRQLETLENCKQCQQRFRKDKMSPKIKKLVTKASELCSTALLIRGGGGRGGSATSGHHQRHHFESQNLQLSSSVGGSGSGSGGVQQIIELQNKLVRKTVTQSRQNSNYTAPSLRQYQYVSSSSQQVYASSIHHQQVPSTTAEKLVWKVKRRADGTRYIVRRLADNTQSERGSVRERSTDGRIKSNVTAVAAAAAAAAAATTEDESVSEVKSANYWTKDDRKRSHVEKSKERRQLQQQQQQKQRQELLMTSTPCSNNPTQQQWIL